MSECIHIHQPIVLASGSAIRAQMLKAVGLNFSVVPSGFDETALKIQISQLPVPEQAKRLAREKALSVSKQYPEHVTIGADQMCAMGDAIFSKPLTHDAAVATLTQLSGQTHQQHSAVCLLRGEEVLWEYCETAHLTMREMTPSEIQAYVHYDQPLHACGSYKFESLGRHLFSRVEGDADVIKGLAMTPLLLTLYQLNVISMG